MKVKAIYQETRLILRKHGQIRRRVLKWHLLILNHLKHLHQAISLVSIRSKERVPTILVSVLDGSRTKKNQPVSETVYGDTRQSLVGIVRPLIWLWRQILPIFKRMVNTSNI